MVHGMPELLGVVDTVVPPYDAQIFVGAGEPDDVPVLDGLDGRFIGCACDVIVLMCTSDMVPEASVRLESWSGEPPRPAGEWDDVQNGRLQVTEASIAVQALWEIDLSERLPLSTNGWHQIRAHAGDRVEQSRWKEEPIGTERFVVQVWPEPPPTPHLDE
jgi:hypothetical protein